MNHDLSNPGRLSLKDLPDEVAAGMFNAWRNGAEVDYLIYGDWAENRAPMWVLKCIYRVRPVPLRPMIIPWDVIDSKWTQAARDEDGSVYLYTDEPFIHHDDYQWRGEGAMYITGLLIGMDPGTVDWRDSKQTRPEGV